MTVHFTLSCLSLTHFLLLLVYTRLPRVGVWFGYPHTLDIEILRLNTQSLWLRKNQITFPQKLLLLRCQTILILVSHESHCPNKIQSQQAAIFTPIELRSPTKMMSGSARTSPGLHIPKQNSAASTHPCPSPVRAMR